MLKATLDVCARTAAHAAVAALVIVALPPCQVSAQSQESKAEVFVVPALGLQYTPPAGMNDKTMPASKQLRERAASYTTKAAQLILDMSSVDPDSSPQWHQIWVFIFPRSQVANLSDATAEAKMNTALAGPRATATGDPKATTIGGHYFLLSAFEQKEPPLLKQAKIYTTICKTQLVSFVLVSNSAEPMKGLEDSLKSITFASK